MAVDDLSLARHPLATAPALALLRRLAVLALALCVPAAAQAQTANFCGDLRNPHGPFDYRTATVDERSLVEGRHFTPPVQALITGTTGTRPGGDIDYTLRAFPNNPRALIAVIALGEKEKTDQPADMRYTVECWLERAVRFRPKDHIVRMIRAGFFGKRGRKAEAIADLKVAESIAGDNPFTFYNLGLIYQELGEYEEALRFAHLAMAGGMPRTELKDKLVAARKWREPEAASAAASAAAPATPASAP
ncbi:conserved exported hypothetical protein [Rubrivivax sp. A210]|uniref:tetratricopeptide repeat protein n=1 Tax=Rubrivivax sp. A210 TaxID=2772301 RepID=UPI00191A5B6C|nr:ABC transporter permease [Rubrivivax sp. A210]CAD5375229.1 conserved exported hypothetical protein [Rubrivivax sp. A210]